MHTCLIGLQRASTTMLDISGGIGYPCSTCKRRRNNLVFLYHGWCHLYLIFTTVRKFMSTHIFFILFLISVKYYKILSMFWIKNADFCCCFFFFNILPDTRDREHLLAPKVLPFQLYSWGLKVAIKNSLFSSVLWNWGKIFLKCFGELSTAISVFWNFTLCANFKLVCSNN